MLDIIEIKDGTVRTEPPGRKVEDVVPQLDPVSGPQQKEESEINLSEYATQVLDKVYAWREDDGES